MDDWEREGLRSANFGMRNQVDHLLDQLDEQRACLAVAQEKLDAARCTAKSADGLVEVTTDASGVVTDVQFSVEAVRSTPEQLGRSVTEAARSAALLARQQTVEIMAPLTAVTDAMPDLPDLVPGAPSLRADP
jgi:DNA-binding protein YbaB